LKDSAPAKAFKFPIMCAIRYSTRTMPLTAITAFLKTDELARPVFGALRWAGVTVATLQS
jgi:hypothetical protein